MVTNGAAAPDGPDEATRTCVKCGTSSLESAFHRSRTGQFSYCRECRRAYDRRYYAERGRVARLARTRARRSAARAWMDTLKEGRACADCGGSFPPYVMQWDHLPGHLKAGDLSVMVGNRSRQTVLEELKKCELVCANCHVLRTVVRARRTIAEEAADYRIEMTSRRVTTGRGGGLCPHGLRVPNSARC